MNQMWALSSLRYKTASLAVAVVLTASHAFAIGSWFNDGDWDVAGGTVSVTDTPVELKGNSPFSAPNATPTFSGIDISSKTIINGVTYYWTSNDGSANQVLTTDGVGNLDWATASGGGGGSGGVDLMNAGTEVAVDVASISFSGGYWSMTESPATQGVVQLSTGAVYSLAGSTATFLTVSASSLNATAALYSLSGSASLPAYTFAGDAGTDTGLYLPAEDVIGFSVSGAEQMRIQDGFLLNPTQFDTSLGSTGFEFNQVHAATAVVQRVEMSSTVFKVGSKEWTLPTAEVGNNYFFTSNGDGLVFLSSVSASGSGGGDQNPIMDIELDGSDFIVDIDTIVFNSSNGILYSSPTAGGSFTWEIDTSSFVMQIDLDSHAELQAQVTSGTDYLFTSTHTELTLDTEWDTIAELDAAVTDGNIIMSTEIASEANLESLIGGANVIVETEIDTPAEFQALVSTGTEYFLMSTHTFANLLGQVGDTQIADDAVDGGSGGEIADNTVDANDIDETDTYAWTGANTHGGAETFNSTPTFATKNLSINTLTYSWPTSAADIQAGEAWYLTRDTGGNIYFSSFTDTSGSGSGSVNITQSSATIKLNTGAIEFDGADFSVNVNQSTSSIQLVTDAGTDITADLEEESHCAEHDSADVDCSGETIVLADRPSAAGFELTSSTVIARAMQTEFFNIVGASQVYAVAGASITVMAYVPYAITISSIGFATDATGTNIDAKLRFNSSNMCINYNSPTDIDEVDTTNGVFSSTSFDDGTIPAGSCIWLAFETAPGASLYQVKGYIEYSYDP